jgi:flagellar export protein FliJ
VAQFRLQRVLDYRRQHEEECEHTLRQVQLLHQQEAARLEALQTEAQAQEEHLEKARGLALSPTELQSWQRYHQVLTQRIAAQQDVVTQASQVVAAQRQQLLVARQETKVIEKLRDRVQQRALLELTRREQQLFDELALMRSRHEL